MTEYGHGVDLLEKEPFELRVFDHFLFGDALDGVASGGGGGFGGQQHVAEAAFAQPTYCVVAVGVEDRFGLALQHALQHAKL